MRQQRPRPDKAHLPAKNVPKGDNILDNSMSTAIPLGDQQPWHDADLEQLFEMFYERCADGVFVFAFYVDESGTHGGSPVMCVSGYLFDAPGRKRLTRRWNSTLGKAGIDVFHMRDWGLPAL